MKQKFKPYIAANVLTLNPATIISRELTTYAGLSSGELLSAKHGAKERMRDGGLNEYDYSARRLNSALPLWTTPDPLALKYSNVSPYAYCASNPIKFTDPTGCEVQGVKSEDAKKAIQDFEEMFRDEVFTQFRKLFVMSKEKGKKKSLAKISQEAINQAFEGVTLSEDQQALVDMAVNTINSDDVHKIEYCEKDKDMTKASKSVFFDEISYIDAVMDNDIVESNGGYAYILGHSKGYAYTKKTKEGSHTIIISKPDFFTTNRAATVGHEIIGHGRSLCLGYDDQESQHIIPIQVENLILKNMGLTNFRDGTDHGPGTPVPTGIPLPKL